MNEFQPTIGVVYPPSNKIEFERYFGENYKGCNTDREYIQVYWCGYLVNHNYGNDKEAVQRLQNYVDSLPNDKQYFTISQFDDGVGVDWKGKDVLEFNMSKIGENKFPLPLIGQAHPFTYDEPKLHFANFIGSKTHPIRDKIFALAGQKGYYIASGHHPIDLYCKIISLSTFTLAPRGYGLNSFRICEALQYGSIPVYISDEFIEPFNIPFNKYGVVIQEKDIDIMHEILKSYTKEEIYMLVQKGRDIYKEYYTYEGCMKNIIKTLEDAV